MERIRFSMTGNQNTHKPSTLLWHTRKKILQKCWIWDNIVSEAEYNLLAVVKKTKKKRKQSKTNKIWYFVEGRKKRAVILTSVSQL